MWVHGGAVLQSSVQHLWIPGKLPSLNELLDARASFGRLGGHPKRWNEYTAVKRGWEHHIAWLVRAQHIEPVEKAYFTYVFIEANRRRNPSNVVSASVKIIEDALQKCGVIKNDGWSEVLGLSAYWEIGKDPGVAVFLSKHAPLDRATALYNDQLQRR